MSDKHPLAVLAEEYILDTACKIVSAGGYSALTYPAVAREARVSLPTVYKYFPDKTLLDAVISKLQPAA